MWKQCSGRHFGPVSAPGPSFLRQTPPGALAGGKLNDFRAGRVINHLKRAPRDHNRRRVAALRRSWPSGPIGSPRRIGSAFEADQLERQTSGAGLITVRSGCEGGAEFNLAAAAEAVGASEALSRLSISPGAHLHGARLHRQPVVGRRIRRNHRPNQAGPLSAAARKPARRKVIAGSGRPRATWRPLKCV